MFANVKRFLFCSLLLTLTTACSDVSFEDYVREDVVDLQQPPPTEFITPTFKTEEFIQGAMVKPVDILFIVDNSPSMIEEQEEIGKRIESFIGELGNVDWRIGITTTDVSNGNFGLQGDLIKFENHGTIDLNKGDSDSKSKFLQTVQREESGCYSNCASSDEQPLLAAIYSIRKHLSENKGFFRPDADLALVILSDEDEMSSGPSYATKPQEVIDTVQQVWGGKKNLRAYGIIIQPTDSKCRRANVGGQFGTHVAELALLTGGVTGSICSDDYSSSLKKIGESVLHLSQTVKLGEVPDPEKIEISFVPESQKVQWTVEGKEIHFSNPPPAGTKIKVKYVPQVTSTIAKQ